MDIPDGYLFIKLINKGKFGKIFLARNKINNNNVVIKSIYINNDINYEKYKRYAMMELKISQIIGCKYPYLLNTIDTINNINVTNYAYIISKYHADNIDLYDAMQSHLLYSLREKINILYQIGLAIECLHTKLYILHRDIKPENIVLYDGNTKAFLIDYGLSHFLNDELFYEQVCGTIEFASPETLFDFKYGTWSDIYSFGLVIYETCYDVHPYAHITNKFKTNREKIEILSGYIKNNIKLPKNNFIEDTIIYDLCLSMVDIDYNKRPTICDVNIKLNEIIESFNR